MTARAPETGTPPARAGAAMWTGRVLTALVVLFLLMDSGMKIARTAIAVDTTVKLGYSADGVFVIGCVLLACTILYAVPQTAVLGAMFLTGYLGGAVATQVIGHVSWFEIFFPVMFAVLMWLGIFLREPRLRAIVPLRCS